MRTMLALLALTLVGGCRPMTAPTQLGHDAVSWEAGPHASEWIQRHYAANDRFPELADLTYHVAGGKLIVDARFVSPPAAIGDNWWGYLILGNGAQVLRPNDSTESLSFTFGNGPAKARRFTEGSPFIFSPASVHVIGPIVRVTCDASLFDFTPTVAWFRGVAHPECDPNGQCSVESWFARALSAPGSVAADR